MLSESLLLTSVLKAESEMSESHLNRDGVKNILGRRNINSLDKPGSQEGHVCEECIQEAPCTAGVWLLGMGAGVETAD